MTGPYLCQRRPSGIQYRNDQADAVELAIPREACSSMSSSRTWAASTTVFISTTVKRYRRHPAGQTFVYHWQACPLPLDDLSGVQFKPGLAPFNGRRNSCGPA